MPQNNSSVRDNSSLLDMYQAGEKVLSFTDGITLEELQSDEMRISAVLYETVVIGEAITRISLNFRAEHPEIPWKSMVGMRNVLIHQYDKVDFDLLWDAIQNGIPEMLDRISSLLPPAPNSAS